METRVVRSQKKEYIYVCRECDYEFSKFSPVFPIRCRQCGNTYTFDETIKEYVEEGSEQLCPICNCFFVTSDYLNRTFSEPHTKWLANMVMHYRHVHTPSWNRMWGKNGINYHRNFYDGSEDAYEKLKKECNERAKRQILRKCKDYIISNGFRVEHIRALQNTDEKTLALYSKILQP